MPHAEHAHPAAEKIGNELAQHHFKHAREDLAKEIHQHPKEAHALLQQIDRDLLKHHKSPLSVEEKDGKITGLNFEHHDIYGRSVHSKDAHGKHAEAAAEKGKGEGQEGGEAGVKGKKAADAKGDGKGNKGDGKGDSKGDGKGDGSGTDSANNGWTRTGDNRWTKSTALPQNWNQMSSAEQGAWQQKQSQADEKSLGDHNGINQRLNGSVVWRGYAGQEPTAAERTKMADMEKNSGTRFV